MKRRKWMETVECLLVLLLFIVKESAGNIPDSEEEDSLRPAVLVDCGKLLPGQYLCSDPDVDPDTQEPRGCSKEGVAPQPCLAIPGLSCRETGNRSFFKTTPCRWTNGTDFQTALLLSVFLGAFGIDRFYLGYPAIGFLKFATLGFFFLGQLLDVILIASQTLGPADGSNYIINYYGPRMKVVTIDNETARSPLPDWY